MNMKLPTFVKIKQHFHGPQVEDIEATVAEQLRNIQVRDRVKPGMRIAITAGSRGVANIARILKALIAELKGMGTDPFIIPAMGSHGGATAEGQVEVLHSYGITEDYCGAKILSSMEVVQVGETPTGMPVYIDKHASEADAIIIVGRIKVHTDFKSPIGIESGLMKMASIGLGKHKQALTIHTYGVQGIRDMMPEVAKVVLEKCQILCGVGIIENAFEQTAKIEAILPERIPERERELLKESAALMPKLPVEDLDLLWVGEIGKNFSGTGMDTNIIGRLRILGTEEPTSPRIKYLIASDLSEETHGNALGIGLADLTTKRLFDKIDYQKMNENVITSTFLHRAMIPIVMENDRDAFTAALRATWGVQPENARMMCIPNTLHLEHLLISSNLIKEVQGLEHVEIIGEPQELEFDADGYLQVFRPSSP